MADGHVINDADLRGLVARNMGRKQIARHFGCTPHTVYLRMRALQLLGPLDANGSTYVPSNLPKVRIERTRGFVSLPAISMFVRAREEARS